MTDADFITLNDNSKEKTVFEKIIQNVKAVFYAFYNYKMYNKKYFSVVNTFNEMDDHLLNDIGVIRGDIPDIAHNTAMNSVYRNK